MFAKVDYSEIMTIRSLDIFAIDAFLSLQRLHTYVWRMVVPSVEKNLSIIGNEFLKSYF